MCANYIKKDFIVRRFVRRQVVDSVGDYLDK